MLLSLSALSQWQQVQWISATKTITIINEMKYDRQSVLDRHHHQDQRLTQRLKRVEQLHIMKRICISLTEIRRVFVLLMAASHGKAHETTTYQYRYRQDLRSEYLLCCKADKSCDYYHELWDFKCSEPVKTHFTQRIKSSSNSLA